MSPDAPRPRVLLVEEKALERLSLASLLEEVGVKVLAVASAKEALEVLGAIPDIQAVVTDADGASPQGVNGFELARVAWREHHIRSVVIAAGEHTDLLPGAYLLAKPVHHATLARLVQDLIRSRGSSLGPVGCPVDRDAPDPGFRTGHPDAGAGWALTPRQQDVLELLVQGKSNQEIADALGLSPNTVKVHLVSVFRALGVSSRTEALLAGLKRRQHQ